MANRFPLVVDTDDSNRIKEIPSGDLLDLNNSGIANLGSLSVAGNLSGGALQSSGTISSTGNATIGGNASITGDASVGGTLDITGTSSFTGAISATSVTATGTIDAANFTVGGSPLSSIQVQSDWTETNVNSAAYIKNKPADSVINSIFDITDVEEGFGGVQEFDILEYTADGVFRSTNRYLRDNQVTFTSNTPSPTPNAGSLTMTTGVGTLAFSWTPPNVPTQSTQLTDTANLVRSGESLGRLDNTTTGYINNAYYVAGTGIELDTVSVPGQSVVNFDNSLAGVQLLGQVGVDSNLTYSKSNPSAGVYQADLALASDIVVGSITANDNLTTSSFQDIEVLSITLNAGGLSSTNGAISLTNGNISTTSGNVAGNNVNATTTVNTPLVANIGGTLSLGANIVALSIAPHLRMGQNATLPSSPSVGDIWHTGETIATYVNEDGSGNPGWIYLGGVAAPGGISLPTFTNTTRPSATKAGQMILNTDTNTVQVSDGSTWINIGP